MDNLIIPLIGDKTFLVEQSLIQQYEATYPNIDVKQQLKEIIAWNQANPSRRKTAKGIKRHINSWLSGDNKQVTNNCDANAAHPSWDKIAGAYFRPLKPTEVKVWEYEFASMLNPAPGGEEIIGAIRSIVADPQGKPEFLSAWHIIKAIRIARKAAKGATLTEVGIQEYVERIRRIDDLEERWDILCYHANPMKIEQALNEAGIEFTRPAAAKRGIVDAELRIKNAWSTGI